MYSLKYNQLSTWGPLDKYGSTLILAWIINHMPNKVWYEITFPFQNFNGATVDIWEWISNFIPNFEMGAITYPC